MKATWLSALAILLVAAVPSVAGAARLPAVNLAALSGADAGAPAASTDTSGCSNRPLTSNFHGHQVAEAILPLEQLPADAVSVPTWSGSFTTDGTTYPYTMVGSDPASGSATTHVQVKIIPLNLDFAASGCTLGDDNMAGDIESSSLFSPTPLNTGVTQWLDDVQRSNFWSTVSTVSPDYHLLLDPTVAPTITLHVPGSQGLTFFDPLAHRTIGVVGGKWLYIRLVNLLNSLHISPTTLAAFVPYNTYATDQNPSDCQVSCAYYAGYHTAVFTNQNPTPHAINTFAMASFLDYGDFQPPSFPTPFDIGAYVLSHEVLEWANDPFPHGDRLQQGQTAFRSNTAPAWSSPYYGNGSICTTTLEVADPLEYWAIITKPVGSATYSLMADGAFLSWFARQNPSTAIYGLYDEAGIFSTYSDTC